MNAKKQKKSMIQGFQVVEQECIWMKAGVVNFRLCDNAYDCINCSFDRGMRRLMEAGSGKKKATYWGEALQDKYASWERTCRHALTGRIDAPKICSLNYECYHCPYDQMLDQYSMSLLTERPKTINISGHTLAKDYYYHQGHSWARFEPGGMVRVGFDDFMLRLFGVLDSLSLPSLGDKCGQDQQVCTIQRGPNEASVMAPLSGTVLAVNNDVLERPEIANQDPYHAGWIFMMEPQEPKKDSKGLYFDREAVKWLEMEHQKLLRLLGDEYESLAATGGELVYDIYSHCPEVGWNTLVQEFLQSK